jgi:twinkle protein
VNIQQVAATANSYAREIAEELLPQGKTQGHYFKVGSLGGEAGQSLCVYLNGPKIGKWFDNATDEHGDVLDLIQGVLGFGIEDAVEWVKNRNGLESVSVSQKFLARQKKLTPLVPPQRLEPKSVENYLRKRGFSNPSEVVDKWGLYQTNNSNLVFPFNRNGQLEFVKLKSMVTGEPRTVTGCGADRYHFLGWDNLPQDARSVWIVEGEIDAITAWSLGLPALSLPQGAGSVDHSIANDFARFERFHTVYIATDQDEMGDRAAKDLKARLKQHCVRIRWDNYKDLNEMLIAEGSDRAMDLINREIENSTDKPASIVTLDDIIDKVKSRLNPDDQLEAVNFDLGWSRYSSIDLVFRYNELIIFGGENGGGKSLAIGMFCLNAIQQTRKICIASFEMPAEVTSERIVRQACGVQYPTPEYIDGCKEWLDGSYFLWNDPAEGIMANIDTVLSDFEYIYRRYNVSVFVIDSLTLMTNVMDSKGDEIHKILTKVCDFKRKFPVTIFLITHVRKGDGQRGKASKDDIKGAGTITDLADTVLMFNPNKKKRDAKERQKVNGEAGDPDLMKQPDVWLECVKHRNGSFHGAISFDIDQKSLQTVPAGMKPKKFFDWSFDG